jgi:branched-chain amino acid transport system permease protein
MLEAILVSGIINGLIYALIALGFTLVYGISGIVSLTHGAFLVIGIYLYNILFEHFSTFISSDFSYLIPLLAMASACILTGIIGSIFYRVTLHQILGDEVGILIASICGCIAFQQLIYIVMNMPKGLQGTFQFSVRSLVPGTIRLMSVDVQTGQVLAALISVAIFITLSLFISKTRSGRSMKALSQDLEAAMLMGISIEKLYILVSAISAGLASLAGILYASTTLFNINILFAWLQALAISYTIVVLGGLGSIKGSLIGGLIFGLAETAFIKIVPHAGDLQRSFPFIVILLILIIRPKGLFGKRVEME